MKPRICEVLGVEVGELFRFGESCTTLYKLDSIGQIWVVNGPKLSPKLCDMINHPEKIIRRPRVTDEEKEILRAAVTLHDAKYIARNVYGCVTVHPEKPKKTESIWHDMAGNTIASKAFKLFESIKWEDEEPTLIEDLLK